MDSFSSFEYFIVISSSLYVRISRKIKRGNLQDISANTVCDISTNVKMSLPDGKRNGPARKNTR